MGVRGKKLTALLGVAVMTASLLSGCGSASENSESTADSAGERSCYRKPGEHRGYCDDIHVGMG